MGLRDFLRTFNLSRHAGDVGDEVREEIEFHLERRAEELARERGLSPAEARAEAERIFGERERHQRRARMWNERGVRRKAMGEHVDALMHDLGFALRSFRRNPGFTLMAVLTLALGIGATTAIFSLADAVFLRAPPVEEPDELALVYTTCRRGQPRCSSSFPDFESYRERSTRFREMAAYTWTAMSVGDGDQQAHLATGQAVSGNYFELLGIAPAAGRLIQPADDAPGGTDAVVVVSHSFRHDHFGGDPEVVGSTVRINGAPFTVVGVAPEGFRGLDLGGRPDLWIPLRSGPRLGEAAGALGREGILESRGSRWISNLVGRLAPGATVEQAREELRTISDALQEEYPDARGGRGITVDPAPTYALPVFQRQELVRLVGILGGVVAFTLLLAAANLANLLLARATARRREIGVRVAIGADRGRLVRQLLTESAALSVVGGGAGLLFARGILDLLSGFRLPGMVPVEGLGAGLDLRVLVFALGVSVATGIAFGLVPALRSTRRDVVSTLKGEATERGLRGSRLRKGLVAVQVAVSVVLLVGSGLFLRTLREALTFDPGFRTDGVALVRYNLGHLRYGETESYDFVRGIEERVASLPGVDGAATATVVPLQAGSHRGGFVEVVGYEPAPDEELRVEYVGVRPGYFDALGIPLAAGRPFRRTDGPGDAPVAVINRTAAERWWPDGDAVGGRMRFAGMTLTVVGVVDDLRWRALEEESGPLLFLSIDQFSSQAAGGFLTLVAGTPGSASDILPAIRAGFRALEPRLALSSVTTMKEEVERVLAPRRMGAALLTAFGVLALVLAAVGIYGVVSYAVATRLREIGIRMALGAGRRTILAGTVVGMALPIGLGLAAGLAGAVGLSGLVEGFMFGVEPTDPVTYAVILAGLGAVALAATLLPARRALRVDPVEVLTVE